jgi:hypothetical protein
MTLSQQFTHGLPSLLFCVLALRARLESLNPSFLCGDPVREGSDLFSHRFIHTAKNSAWHGGAFEEVSEHPSLTQALDLSLSFWPTPYPSLWALISCLDPEPFS